MAKKKKPKYLGSGAEATVYDIGNGLVNRVMHVNAGWKEKNRSLLKILRKLARNPKKTRYLCPVEAVSVRKFKSKITWKQNRYTHTVTITMPKAKHTNASRSRAFDTKFRDNVRKECEKIGIPPPTDWHSYNVMQLGKKIVRIDYFPWYMAATPDWMKINRKENLDYGGR